MQVQYDTLPEVLQNLGYTVQEMEGELVANRGGMRLLFVRNSEGEAIGIVPSEVREALTEQGYGNFKPSSAAPTGTEGTGSEKFKVKTGEQAQAGDLTGSDKVDTKGKELPPEYRSHGKNNEDPKHPSTKSGAEGPSVGAHGGGKSPGANTSDDSGRHSDGIEVADIYPPNVPGSNYTGTKVGSVSGSNLGPGKGGGKAPQGGTAPAGLEKTQGAQAGVAKIPGPGPGVMAVKRSSMESAFGEAYVPGGDPRAAAGGGIRRAGVYKGGKTTPGRTAKGKVEAGPLKPERKPGESNADYQKRMLAYKKSVSQESMTEAEPQGRFAILLTRESVGTDWAVSKSLENTPENLQALQNEADQTVAAGAEDIGAAIFVTDSELGEIPDSARDMNDIVGQTGGQVVSQHGMAQEGVGAVIAKAGRTAADVAKGAGRAAGSIGGVAARGAGALGKAVGTGVGVAGKSVEKSAAGKHADEIEDDDESHHESLQICPHCFVPMDLQQLAEGISTEQAIAILEQFPGDEDEEEEDDDLEPELAGEAPPEGDEEPMPPEGGEEMAGEEPTAGEPPPLPPDAPPPPPPPSAEAPPLDAPAGGAGMDAGADTAGGVPCPNCGEDVRQKLEVAGILQNLAHEIYARAAGAAAGATAILVIVAILLAIASPAEIDLLGLTAVAGNVPLDLTQKNARMICELAGHPEIPVFAGCDRPLDRALVTAEHVHGRTGLDGPTLPDPVMPLQDTHAVSFLIDTLRQQPAGSVTLCALGPLTNIAKALTDAPDIAERIAGIVLMGGAYFEVGNFTPTAEFNIYVDPQAADIVLRSGVEITILPLDVTHKALVTPARNAAFRALGSPVGVAVAEMTDFFERFDKEKYGSEGAPLHDP
ncbi:hypothetical protein LCGC14_0162910, partial [marine sediment metagenome]